MTATVDVLIVDDQEPFRSVAPTLVRVLPAPRVAGEAATGEGTVAQALAAPSPAVVLTDINPPVIDGIEATRRILAHSPDVAVALLSARRSPDDLRRARPPAARPSTYARTTSRPHCCVGSYRRRDLAGDHGAGAGGLDAQASADGAEPAR